MLDAPEPSRAATRFKRGAPVTEMPLRRDSYAYADDFADDSAGFDAASDLRQRWRAGIRVSFRGGLLPKSLWGKIALGCGCAAAAAGAIAGALAVRSFVLHDGHFVVPNAESIQIAGNSRLTRPQLLSVFGEDVGGNVFAMPLAERRAELESLPWVERATVMRLLPNRVRVAVVERTPVAFVRQATRIGLVDANGMIFDLPEAGDGGQRESSIPHYSFPVLSGISATDPLSTRSARMRIYMGFLTALDAGGENISHQLSEVDLADPEDVRAVPGTGSGKDILVHFGGEKYLERYHQFQQHIAEWRAQYPKLASVDMRYERQVVLQMQPGATVAASGGDPASGAPAANDSSGAAKAQPDVPKTTTAAAGKAPPAKAQIAVTHGAHSPAMSPHAKPAKPAGRPAGTLGVSE